MIHSELLLPDISFPVLQRLSCEADHRPAPRAEFKNEWKSPFTPTYVFTARRETN
jgi:hypothetical protein